MQNQRPCSLSYLYVTVLSGKMGSRAALSFFSDVSLLLSRVMVCGCPVAYSRQAFSEHEDWVLLNGQKEKK